MEFSRCVVHFVSIQLFSTKQNGYLRVALQCHWTLGDLGISFSTENHPKWGFKRLAPGEKKKQRSKMQRFSQRNKADPNWALSEGLSAGTSAGCSPVVLWSFYASENLGVFISMWFSVGSEDAPLFDYRLFLRFMEMASFDSEDTATSWGLFLANP